MKTMRLSARVVARMTLIQGEEVRFKGKKVAFMKLDDGNRFRRVMAVERDGLMKYYEVR